MQERQDKYADELMFSGVLSRDGIYIWRKRFEASAVRHTRIVA